MSAKPAKKRPNQGSAPAGPVTAATASAASGGDVQVAAASGTEAGTSWLESSDPRKRLYGKLILAAVWLYVAALWLLALDQTFGWGIFGAKTPPQP
ncbi:MAG: hypothetical protein HZC55_15960 [Verrucomicrobia bacterium]|nr:hypothetical protein [Verrucomicrobiota bacterium]